MKDERSSKNDKQNDDSKSNTKRILWTGTPSGVIYNLGGHEFFPHRFYQYSTRYQEQLFILKLYSWRYYYHTDEPDSKYII